MFLQPKVNLSDGRVAGAEALIRWRHPSLGLLAPADFIPMVEKTVLLQPLTHWALDHVLGIWRGWSEQGVKILIAVNVSPRTLLDQDLPTVVDDLLQRWGPASVPAVGDHRELPRRGLRSFGDRPERPRSGRRRAVDRRLRHGLLVAVLPGSACRSRRSRSIGRSCRTCWIASRTSRPCGPPWSLAEPGAPRRGGGRPGPRDLRPSRRLRLRRGPGLLASRSRSSRRTAGAGCRVSGDVRRAGVAGRRALGAPRLAPRRLNSLGMPVATRPGLFVLRGRWDVAPGRADRLVIVRAVRGTPARPIPASIVVDVEAGQGFLLAGLAVALDGPVLVVTPGRREAEDLEAEVGSYLGDDVALLPRLGRAAVRGDGSVARGRARVAQTPSRVCAPPPVRSSSSRRTWPRCSGCRRRWGPSPGWSS